MDHFFWQKQPPATGEKAGKTGENRGKRESTNLKSPAQVPGQKAKKVSFTSENYLKKSNI